MHQLKLLVAAGVLAILPNDASAQNADNALAQNICAAVESETLEMEPKRNDVMYQYQTLIADAAGVTATDTEAVYYRKMRDWLNANMPLCDRVNFQPRWGNLLKLAVARQADPFLDHAITSWHVDLNHVDSADGGTLLDYVQSKIDEAGSNMRLAQAYQRYYNRLRSAGALHAKELH